ncbi:RNA-binding domain-containing protein [Dentipellis sp. KUC8613]|nr:RNA-binding domain-containing protein [Dentipellis sp. KUC8613]
MSDAPAAPVTENGAPPATQEQPVEETPGFKVFAGNLAYSTTDEGLKAFFAPVESDIISAQVIMRGTRSAGYGFVALTSAEAAQKAVEALDKKELDGRPIIVEVAKPADQKDQEKKEKKARRRPGRRGAKAVPGEVTDAEANGDAEKADDAAAGDAEKPKKKKKKAAKKPKRQEGAEGDASAGDAPAEGDAAKQPRKKRAPRPPRPAGEEPVGEPSKTVLFVANLGFNIDDAGLSALFTDANIKVVSARIVRRRWGRPRKSKGYGFVDVGDEEEQKKAIEALQGKDVGGRPIAVKIAVNTQVEEEEKAEAEATATDAPAQKEATPEATREVEAREEGLSKSLFERAAEEEAAGSSSGNKALAMMMKMGFKPGQSLGKVEDAPTASPPDSGQGTPVPETSSAPATSASPPPTGAVKPHRLEPLPINEWAGRKGIGLGKRSASPTELEHLAKVAKVGEAETQESYRDRTRREFEQRRAEGRLVPAQMTCVTLDEKAGISYNVLWLNPDKPDSYPAGLLEALAERWTLVPDARVDPKISVQERLRSQMEADALQPLADLDDDAPPKVKHVQESMFSPEQLEKAVQFLSLPPQDKLQAVLDYLRSQYHYCFWCGTEYSNAAELQELCPGPEEDAHD